jgi:hypothetical protein
MGYIYILTSPSGKSYIGQTTRPIHKRLEEHRTGKPGCRAIYNAIQKHGWDNFEKDWYECPDSDLNKHEELMVEVLGTLAPDGYNLKEGGGNGKLSDETKQKISDAQRGENHHMWGDHHDEDTIQKMSDAHRGENNHMYGRTGEKNPLFGKTRSEDTKQKISEAHRGDKNHMYGKTHSENAKQKMSEAIKGDKHYNYGKTLSEDTKRKISEAKKGEKNHMHGKTGESNHSSKKVYQYDLDGKLLGTFGSGEEAERYLDKPNGSSIRACAGRKQKTAYGFKWSYTQC